MKLKKIGTWLLVVLFLVVGSGWLAARNSPIGAYYANSFSSADWRSNTSVIEVPISQSDRHIVIPVYLNGEGPFRFVLDTGAPMTAIFGSQRTEQLKLKAAGSIPVGGAGTGESVSGSIVNDVDIAIGDVTLNQQTLIVMPWKELPFAVGTAPLYDGVIGYDLLKRYPVELDISNHQMRIHNNNAISAGDQSVTLPLSFTGRKPYLLATTKLDTGAELETKLQVDIGSTGTLSLLPGSLPEIQIPESSVERFAWGLSGKVTSQVSRIPALTLGDIELPEVITAFSVSGAASSGKRHGLLGLGILERFDMIINYPAKQIVLRKTNRVTHAFEMDMAGMDLAPEDDLLRVRHVYPGSPAAAAEITAGDHITQISDKPSMAYTQRELARLMRENGKKVHLCIQTREGKQRCTDVVLSRSV